MHQFKAGDTNAVVLAGMCTALAVVLSMVGFYVPIISILGLLALPLPIAYLGIREGVKWSVIATSGVMILNSAFFGITMAFYLTVMFGMTGIVMAYAYRKQFSAAKTFGCIVVVMFLSLALNALFSVLLMGMSWEQLNGNMLNQMKDMSKEMTAMMYSGEQLDQVNQQTDDMYAIMMKLLPSAIVVSPMVLAWGCMAMEKKILGRLGIQDVPQFPPLERWHFPRIFLLFFLLAVGMQFLPMEDRWKDMAYNVGALCYFVLWIQGIATLWWLPHRYPVLRRFRLILLVISIWIPMLQLFTVYLGVSDMALNYRKKHGGQENQ